MDRRLLASLQMHGQLVSQFMSCSMLTTLLFSISTIVAEMHLFNFRHFTNGTLNPKPGTLFRGPHNKDYSILGSKVGSPYLGNYEVEASMYDRQLLNLAQTKRFRVCRASGFAHPKLGN